MHHTHLLQVDDTSIITNGQKTKPVGGYEYAFVDPPERLLCNVCEFPCREAYMAGCRGNNFCKSCLSNFLAKEAKYDCPHSPECEFSYCPNEVADKQIKALEIFCPNKDKGCEWTGKLSDIDKHFIDGKCHDVKYEMSDKEVISSEHKAKLCTNCEKPIIHDFPEHLNACTCPDHNSSYKKYLFVTVFTAILVILVLCIALMFTF